MPSTAVILLIAVVLGALCLILAITGQGMALFGQKMAEGTRFVLWQRFALLLVGVGLLVFVVFTYRGSGGKDQLRLALTPFLQRDTTSSQCLPLKEAYIRFTDLRIGDDFVQCREDVAQGAALRLDFIIPPYNNATLLRVDGEFGIDQEGGVDQRGATATWNVSYNGQEICQVSAAWNQPGTCRLRHSHLAINGGTLTITQKAYNRNPGEPKPLFVGVAHLALQLG